MDSPPQNAGSDCEDGEVASSEDEGVGKDSIEEAPKHSPNGVTRQREEDNNGDSSPQRKVFPQKFRISTYFKYFFSHLLYLEIPTLHFFCCHFMASILSHLCFYFQHLLASVFQYCSTELL